jgi:outer membrane protein OmpA-like peptidoglycan-associated protein
MKWGRVATRLVAVVALGVVSGCSILDDSTGDHGVDKGQSTSKRNGGPAGAGASVRTGGPIVREGYYDADSFPARFRVEMQRVERLEKYSVLRFSLTNLSDKPAFGSSMFGEWRVDGSFSAFKLVDTVGRKLYKTLREGSEDGDTFGSYYSGTQLYPGVRYQAQVYFPPLPASTRQVSVLTTGTTAEMNGVPVVDAGAPPAVPTEQSESTPAPGQTSALADYPPKGQLWSHAEDLYDIVESPQATTTSGGGGETVALPTDVLFAFDSAALSGKAQAVIDKAVAELKSRADPAKSVSIEGHTDGKGTASYNQPLSERRATAVRDALQKGLSGQSYTFQTAGKGSDEPVAKETTASGADNPAGRARNRRVEITYTLRPAAAASRPAASGSGGFARGSAGAPAAFRANDGPVVAERSATVDQRNAPEHFQLRVHPFYRDGAYLVAVFELNNVGDELNAVAGFRNYFGADDFIGGDYGSFKVFAGDTIYRAVRRGPQAAPGATAYSDYLSGSIMLGDPNVPGRTYMYIPAPPPDVRAVTFDAGVFGKIANVPIQ